MSPGNCDPKFLKQEHYELRNYKLHDFKRRDNTWFKKPVDKIFKRHFINPTFYSTDYGSQNICSGTARLRTSYHRNNNYPSKEMLLYSVHQGVQKIWFGSTMLQMAIIKAKQMG